MTRPKTKQQKRDVSASSEDRREKREKSEKREKKRKKRRNRRKERRQFGIVSDALDSNLELVLVGTDDGTNFVGFPISWVRATRFLSFDANAQLIRSHLFSARDICCFVVCALRFRSSAFSTSLLVFICERHDNHW